MLRTSFSRQPLHAHASICLIMFLCLCVILQVLGVPATLLETVDQLDPLSVMVLEGWSIPQTSLALISDSPSNMASHVPFARYLPDVLNAVFHPPLV